MKSLIATILSVALALWLSGCEGKNFGFSNLSLPKMSVPSLDMSSKVLDRNLPTVEGLKIKSSLSEVALEWKPVRKKHIAGYRIFRNNDEGGFTLIQTIPDPYVAHYTDINTNQHKYNRYMVSVFTDDGRVSLGKKIRISKIAKPLAPLPFVTTVSNLPNRIKLLWRIHPDPRVTGYLIERLDPATKTWQKIARVDKRLSVEYIDKNVQPGRSYQYRVFALAGDRDSVRSPASKVVTGKSKFLPPPIRGLKATTNLARKVELIWKKSPQPDIDHYNIYASNFVDGIFTLIGRTRALNFTDKFDNDGEIRFYKVTAVDVDGLESTKAIKAVRGMTLGHLKAPIITSAKVINNKVELKWQNQDSRSVAYNIYKSYWDGWRVKKIKIKGFKQTTFVDPNIKPDTDYTYYVKAVDANGIESLKSRSIKVEIQGSSSPKKKSWF